MSVVLFAALAVICGIPFVAAGIVSVASKREDAAWSLDRPARTPIEAAARRIVDFRTELTRLPVTKEQALARTRPARADGERVGAGAPSARMTGHPPASDQKDYAGAPVG